MHILAVILPPPLSIPPSPSISFPSPSFPPASPHFSPFLSSHPHLHLSLCLPSFLPPPSSHSLFVVFPARAPSNITQLTPEQVQMGVVTGEGRNSWTQAGFQVALLGVTLAVSIRIWRAAYRYMKLFSKPILLRSRNCCRTNSSEVDLFSSLFIMQGRVEEWQSCEGLGFRHLNDIRSI